MAAKPPKSNTEVKTPKDDARSFEVLRAWVADGDLHTDFISNLWDPSGYGTFLADLARQLTDGILEDDPSLRPVAVLAQIRKGFLDELDSSEEAEIVRSKR